ncbi:MAG: hypothetical protein QM731_01160 [Chitinophagaceae bacterium]
MRTLYAIPFICFISLQVACNSEPQKRDPSTLKGKRVDVSSMKREQYDLVERIYAELADTAADLKEIEYALKDLKKRTADSLHDRIIFENENAVYYNVAYKKLLAIQDTALRRSVRKIIDNSAKAYRLQMTDWKKLDTSIEKKRRLINDLYIMLKVTRTLAFMHEYQQPYMPPTSQGHAIDNEMDSIILRLDSLIKK